jgi:SAM-dependent methyltransferase
VATLVQRLGVLAHDPSAIRIRPARGACPVCGRSWPLVSLRVITDQLAAEWELDDVWRARLDEREGTLCLGCRNSRRTAGLAAALVSLAAGHGPRPARCLSDLMSEDRFTGLRIAELNACGNLHRVLQRHPRLTYAEYGGAPGVDHQDLHALTYPDDSFDLVLTSDTLEHVPDPGRALTEIRRVLRPGGHHVFTVPIVPDGRPTRRRASDVGGTMRHDLPPSYHGRPGQRSGDLLVVHEFGMDFLAFVDRRGFRTRVISDADNPMVMTLVSHAASSGVGDSAEVGR